MTRHCLVCHDKLTAIEDSMAGNWDPKRATSICVTCLDRDTPPPETVPVIIRYQVYMDWPYEVVLPPPAQAVRCKSGDTVTLQHDDNPVNYRLELQ